MASVVALPNGRTAHLKTGAAVEALPDGRMLNQVGAGGGTTKDLAASGTASATATADLSTGAAAFKAASYYFQLLGDCNV
jgi:hypothetical protein